MFKITLDWTTPRGGHSCRCEREQAKGFRNSFSPLSAFFDGALWVKDHFCAEFTNPQPPVESTLRWTQRLHTGQSVGCYTSPELVTRRLENRQVATIPWSLACSFGNILWSEMNVILKIETSASVFNWQPLLGQGWNALPNSPHLNLQQRFLCFLENNKIKIILGFCFFFLQKHIF